LRDPGIEDKLVGDDQATQRLAELLGQIGKLPSANLEPPQFFARFLQLTVAATGSGGGAIWVIQPGQSPQCYCHIELELCRIQEADQQRLVLEAIDRTVKEGKALVLPGGGLDHDGSAEPATVQTEQAGTAAANRSPYPLFFKPLRAAGQVAMVAQMIGAEGLSAHDYRTVVSLLDKTAESAETYLAHRRAAVLEDDRKALACLLQYAEAVHGSLDAEKVVYQIANLGRDALGCTRLVVWIDPAVKRGLRAVSGVDKPDRRAVLLQSIEKLSKHCLQIKKPIVAARKQLVELDEEDKLTTLLKDYFNASQLDEIFLQPIRKGDDFLGVLAAEGFEQESSTNLAGMAAAVSKHGALALSNALEMASVPLVRPLGKLQKVKKDPKKRRKWLTVSATVLAALVLAALVPWTVQIDCTCRLTPRHMRVIDSPLDGLQISKIHRPSGYVEAGEIIAQLNDAELQARRYSLEAALEQEQLKKDQAARSEDKDISRLECERRQGELDLVNLQIDQCKIRAPISGTILTDRLDLKEGMTLRRGDPICEIADLNTWQLVLEVTQQEIDWVQRGLAHGQQSTVVFFLAAYPEHKLQTTIENASQIGQLAHIKDQGNFFEIRVDVSQDQLSRIWQGLREGMIGRAKIGTVKRALGYVLLRKVIRFFRVAFF